MTPLAASLVLGLVWAAFHWVALLGNGDAAPAYIAISTIQLTAMSVILAFVFNNARQALPVVAFVHAMYDTISIGVVPLVETGVPLLAFALSAGLTALVALGVVAATGASLAIRPRVAAAHGATCGMIAAGPRPASDPVAGLTAVEAERRHAGRRRQHLSQPDEPDLFPDLQGQQLPAHQRAAPHGVGGAHQLRRRDRGADDRRAGLRQHRDRRRPGIAREAPARSGRAAQPGARDRRPRRGRTPDSRRPMSSSATSSSPIAATRSRSTAGSSVRRARRSTSPC